MSVSVFYSNPDFLCERTFNKRLICNKKYYTRTMQTFLSKPDVFLEQKSEKIFKNKKGDTTTIGVIELENAKFVVKRYNFKGGYHAVKQSLRLTRAMRSWFYAHYLERLGIPTVKPVAVCEQYRFCFFEKAYFITEYEESIDAWSYFNGSMGLPKNWKIVAGRIVNIVNRLADLKITHGDLRCGNMLVIQEKPILVDLDHVHEYDRNNWIYRRKRLRDVAIFKRYVGEHFDLVNFFENKLRIL